MRRFCFGSSQPNLQNMPFNVLEKKNQFAYTSFTCSKPESNSCKYLISFGPKSRHIAAPPAAATKTCTKMKPLSRGFAVDYASMANENKNDHGFVSVYNTPSSTKEFHHEYDGLRTRIFKIIVIGDSNVGKTCLSYRFCGGRFLKNPEATIGVDFRERTVDIDGENIKLQIWDTAGQERFRKSMVEHYYRNVHAVIFVYDITKLSSFESLPEWIEECGHHSVPPMVPRILVGNKCDLKGKGEVPTSLAQRLADGYDFPLFETSAKDPAEKEHVDAIFLTLAYKLKNHKPLRLRQPVECGSAPLSEEAELQRSCLC